MPDTERLDAAYRFIMSAVVATGEAPHYTALAQSMDLEPEAGRVLLHDLIAVGLPNWLFPDTDLIASFAPFNNLPTHYRVSVDGEQKWFAQCGLESVAISWLFPGKLVEIDAPCLDCGEPLHVAMRDGRIVESGPDDMVFYVNLPIAKWYNNLPFA